MEMLLGTHADELGGAQSTVEFLQLYLPRVYDEDWLQPQLAAA